MAAHRATTGIIGINTLPPILHIGNIIDSMQQCSRVQNSDHTIAGISATTLNNFRFASGDLAILSHTHLDINIGFRTAFVGKKGLFPRQLHLHLATCRFCQQTSNNLKIEGFGARSKAAANKRFNDTDTR